MVADHTVDTKMGRDVQVMRRGEENDKTAGQFVRLSNSLENHTQDSLRSNLSR